jgi:hypothetical protein
MNPRVVPSGFLCDDGSMQKTKCGSTIVILASVLLVAAVASGKSAAPEKKDSFYFRVPHESVMPQLLEECPSIVMPQPKRIKACAEYVSGDDIKALRCESLDGRFVYLVYKTKEDCLIDREAALANEG